MAMFVARRRHNLALTAKLVTYNQIKTVRLTQDTSSCPIVLPVAILRTYCYGIISGQANTTTYIISTLFELYLPFCTDGWREGFCWFFCFCIQWIFYVMRYVYSTEELNIPVSAIMSKCVATHFNYLFVASSFKVSLLSLIISLL